eukprot:7331675-Ditylum_brightwellii.AAC.1
MTFDTTAYVAFGCKMNSLQAPEKGQHHFAQAFDKMQILITACRDTTACAISWAFFEIIKWPGAIQNIVQEATQICGGTNGYTHDT